MGTIVLTGFMCTGKSEVGRRLAKRLGRPFVDTDQLVEAQAGKSVAAIFSDDGEAAFRALEREAVVAATARGDVARRPLLAGGDPRATVERLLGERGPAYERAADVTVDTSDRTVGEVVETVHEHMGRLERTNRWKSST